MMILRFLVACLGVFSMLLGLLSAIKYLSSQEMECHVIGNNQVPYRCIMDNDYECKTKISFLFTLKIDCKDKQIYDVYSRKRMYCECCDSKYCQAHWEPTVLWFPFETIKYRLLSSNANYLSQYQQNTSYTFYKSNGYMYFDPLEDAAMKFFVSILICSIGTIIIATLLWQNKSRRDRYRVLESQATAIEMQEIQSK